MKVEDLEEFFEKHSDEYIKFDRVASKTSGRADLHLFNMLDKLVPGTADIVSCADHDEVWLEVDPYALVKVATEEQLIDMIRCGLRYDSCNDAFALFV